MLYVSQLDQVDYVGPMHITHFAVDYDRPSQTISSTDPSFYYYYVGDLTIEWGHAWGCPGEANQNKWCKARKVLSEYDSCSSRKITCHNDPNES